MSIYSTISKRIGWEGKAQIPSIKTAKELRSKVINNNDTHAFERVFRNHRFAPSPTNVVETEAMNINHQAYLAGTKIFS